MTGRIEDFCWNIFYICWSNWRLWNRFFKIRISYYRTVKYSPNGLNKLLDMKKLFEAASFVFLKEVRIRAVSCIPFCLQQSSSIGGQTHLRRRRVFISYIPETTGSDTGWTLAREKNGIICIKNGTALLGLMIAVDISARWNSVRCMAMAYLYSTIIMYAFSYYTTHLIRKDFTEETTVESDTNTL